MWAQGLTIGVLIAAGILTHANRKEAAEHVRVHVTKYRYSVPDILLQRQVDHTWQGMVQEFENEERERKQYQLMHAPAPAHASTA